MEAEPWVSLIDSINTVVSKNFTKLAAFTFNYDSWTGLNRSLFTDYLNIDLDNFDNINTFCLSANESLKSKIDDYNSLYSRLLSEWEEDLWEKFQYYKINLEKIGIFLDLLSRYIPLEAEKISKFQTSGQKIFQSSEERHAHIWAIEEKEEEIFWKKLSDLPNYASSTVTYITEVFGKNKSQLSHDETHFMEWIIKDLKSKYPQTWDVINNSGYEELLLEDPLDDYSSEEIFQRKIPREKYVEIFKLAIDVLWLDYKVVVWDYPNFSVQWWEIWEPWELRVPQSWENYDTLKVKRIIAMVAHELERHAIGNVNNKSLLWNMKSLSYLWQEEWVAHVMEHLAIGYNLDEIPLNRYMPRMLIWELYSWDDFKKFLHILNKLEWENLDVEKFFQRFKRWKDFSLPWVNPKEKLYGTGALEIIER